MDVGLNSNNKLSSSGNQLTYGATRRLLGICYVGTIVSFSIVALVSGLAVHWFGTTDRSSVEWFANVLRFVGAFEILSLPFDLTGFQIERAFEKTRQPFFDYLTHWCKAAFKHAMIFLACIFVFTSAARVAGLLCIAVSSLFLALLFIWKQAEIARFLSEVQFEEPGQELRGKFVQNRSNTVNIVIARSPEIGFTGGIVGLPGAESIIIPERWLDRVSERRLWAEITRRNSAISSGSRQRGVAGAVLFTVTGVLIASACTKFGLGQPLESSAGAVDTSLFFTVWSFIGLILLPSINQRGVLEVDQKAVAKGVSKELLLETILDIDKMMENEPERSNAVQFVFHPIPTPKRRMAAIETGTMTRGAWHVARYAIWLSLAGLGLLGRAVHCNAGKPDLWCMLPAD
jgi:hypothetical protein